MLAFRITNLKLGIKIMKSILEAKEVRKIYNKGKETEVKALDGVDIKVQPGELVAIMGPSGSGKTTLLNCISGIDKATSGSIIVDGQDLQKMNDRKKTKYRSKKMGFIFQSYNLIPVLTAIENVKIPLLINGMKLKNADKKATEMLDSVGLGNRLYHKPNELSGGQQQRVTIARALVHKPSIVWADEPTGNLDSKTAQDIMDLIIELNNSRETTFVLVTHDHSVAKQAERIVKLENGKRSTFHI
jgi:putative ABC transport system ATP-binding protein